MTYGFWRGLALAGLAAMVIAGCGESSTEDGAGSSGPLRVLGGSGSELDPTGTWQEPCVGFTGSSEQWVTVFQDTNTVISTESTWVSNTTCTGTADFKLVSTADAGNAGDKSGVGWDDSNAGTSPDTPAGLNATVTASKVDYTVDSEVVTVNTTAGANALNGDNAFNKGDWVSGDVVNVTGTEYDGTTYDPATFVGHDLAFVDDSGSPLVMYFGNDEAGLDAGGHPDNLWPDAATKQ